MVDKLFESQTPGPWVACPVKFRFTMPQEPDQSLDRFLNYLSRKLSDQFHDFRFSESGLLIYRSTDTRQNATTDLFCFEKKHGILVSALEELGLGTPPAYESRNQLVNDQSEEPETLARTVRRRLLKLFRREKWLMEKSEKAWMEVRQSLNQKMETAISNYSELSNWLKAKEDGGLVGAVAQWRDNESI